MFVFGINSKGEKEKNIVDVHDFKLALPTLEYHSRTWTWLDLLLAMKKDCISCLVSQVKRLENITDLLCMYRFLSEERQRSSPQDTLVLSVIIGT